jgi:hypothetical protein
MSKATAALSSISGRAVITEPDGRVFSLEHDWTEPKEETNMHVGMYLQPAMGGYEERDAGEYPYTELHEYLKSEYRKEQALAHMSVCFDGKLSDKLRLECAKEILEPMLQDPEIEAFVKNLALSVPPSETTNFDGLPTEGKIGEIVAEAKKKWRPITVS